MKHTISVTLEIEAPSWDLAVEEMLRTGYLHATYCGVKTPKVRKIHVNQETLHHARVLIEKGEENVAK